MKQKFFLWLVILFICFTQLLFSNPIPIPSLLMPEEWIDILILEEGETGTSPGLKAVVDGKYPMKNLDFEKVQILDPVPPGSHYILVQMNGRRLPFSWSQLTYPTILPEWPEIPQLAWTIAPVPQKFTLDVHYEHDLIKRPGEMVFLYPSGCWEGQPVYTERMTAHFTAAMPNRYVPKSVYLDYDPVPFAMNPVYRDATVEPGWLISGEYQSKLFRPIERDYILTMIDRWEDPLCWFSQVPDMADGVDIISSSGSLSPVPVPMDDFTAPATGITPPVVSTIKWWGSFPGWARLDPAAQYRDCLPPRPRSFTIAVYDTGVSSIDGNGAVPRRLVYKAEIEEFSQSYYSMVVRCDPDATGEDTYIYEHEFAYETSLKRPFVPVPGKRYWMSIVAGPVSGGAEVWGWATSMIDDTPGALAAEICNDGTIQLSPVDEILDSSLQTDIKPDLPVQMAFALCTTKDPAPAAIPYMLLDESYLTVEYAYEDPDSHTPPVLMLPITGNFLLLPVSPEEMEEANLDSAFRHFTIKDLEFRPLSYPDTFWGHDGTGTYLLSKTWLGNQKQRMRLKMAIDRCAPIYFESGYVEVPQDIHYPWIDISLDMIPPFECGNRRYSLKLVAVPRVKMLFSTENGFTPGNPVGQRTVSDGDLLSPAGSVVRTNRELVNNFLPADSEENRNYGLDAILTRSLFISDEDPLNKLDICFSLETDLKAGNRVYDDGDLLSDRGVLVKDNLSLVAPFHPMPVIPPMGLDAVTMASIPAVDDTSAFLPDDNQMEDSLVSSRDTLLYSFEVSFFSESLGVMVNHGDLLLENGTIYRTNKQLLENFHPLSVTDDGFGLDAVYVWPNGEVWFSTEKEFVDSRLGYVGHGDLLSTNGRVVIDNLSLVREFAPLEDLNDFGLDGLHINLPRYSVVPGSLVEDE